MKGNTALFKYINLSFIFYSSTIFVWAIIAFYFLSPYTEVMLFRILESNYASAQQNQAYTLSKLTILDNSLSKNASAPLKVEQLKSENAYTIDSNKQVVDGRVVALRRFLLDRNSPMANHADLIVTEADRYNMDWRILVGISGVESNFGTITPSKSHNAWGWRGGPGGDYSRFNGWEESIRHITRRLALGYGGLNGSIDPYEIEATYCPPCAATGQHYWASAVNSFMYQIDVYAGKR